MANVICIYTDKNGVNHEVKVNNMKTKTAYRILEEGKVSQREQRRRVHDMKKEDMEYEDR